MCRITQRLLLKDDVGAVQQLFLLQRKVPSPHSIQEVRVSIAEIAEDQGHTPSVQNRMVEG
ncbi:hypothetical protein D3C75_827290 [compost metagenome]